MDQLFLATILAYIGASIGAITRLTKIIGLLKFQDIERSNFTPSFLSIVSGFIWLYYDFVIKSLPLILSAVINIFEDIIIICLTYYVIRKKRKIITV